MFRFIALLPNINDIGKKEKRKIINFSFKYTFLEFLKLTLFVLIINVINVCLSLFLTNYIYYVFKLIYGKYTKKKKNIYSWPQWDGRIFNFKIL